MSDPSQDFTPSLGLAYLLSNQAQKHLTVNDSLSRLDALVMAQVEGIGAETPPVSPAPGEAWIIGDAPDGGWAGQAGRFAVFMDGAWLFLTPQTGWCVWLSSEAALYGYDGAAWGRLRAETQNINRLGIATDADAANPLSARLNSALLTALESGDGGTGDLRLTLNKAQTDATASLLLQTDYGARGELGLVGDDDLTLRVMEDGGSWREAMRLHRNDQPGGERVTVNGGFGVRNGEEYFLLSDNFSVDIFRANNQPVFVRTRSAGTILNFGVTNSAGSLNTNALSIRPDDEEIRVHYTLSPHNGSTPSLGEASRPFATAYLTSSPVVSSDARLKHEVCDLEGAGALLRDLRPVSYRRFDGGPVHFGFIAQEVQTALEANGLTGAALWEKAPAKAGEDGLEMLRLEELIAVLVGAVQILSAEIEHLKTGSRS